MIFLYAVDGSHSPSCSDPNFWLYKSRSNVTVLNYLLRIMYNFWVPPTMCFLLRFDLCISCCDWYIPYLYFSLTYVSNKFFSIQDITKIFHMQPPPKFTRPLCYSLPTLPTLLDLILSIYFSFAALISVIKC